MVPPNLDPHYIWRRKLEQFFSPWIFCLVILINDVRLQALKIHSYGLLVSFPPETICSLVILQPSSHQKVDDDDDGQSKTTGERELAIEVWSFMLLVAIYFCKKNFKALACRNMGAFFFHRALHLWDYNWVFILFWCPN